MKNFVSIVVALFFSIMAVFVNYDQNIATEMRNLGVTNFTIYDTGEIEQLLDHTREMVIVERCIGIVTDAKKGDGKILNTTSEYDYISYRGVKGNLHKGDIIITYFVYNPDSNYIDDIIYRFDY